MSAFFRPEDSQVLAPKPASLPPDAKSKESTPSLFDVKQRRPSLDAPRRTTMNSKLLDATPEKRIFLSIISEYDLKRSLCELIDNAIDLWSKKKRADLVVNILADDQQQSISIEDNAGGIEEANL